MHNHLSSRILGIFILVALAAYLLPWVSNSASGLTMGAYDLAEWLSLHPATHPDRLPSLMLRGQLLIMTWIIAFSVEKPIFTANWWIHAITAILLTVAQMPPAEFVHMTGDLNQRQQAVLAVISMIGACAALSGLFRRYRLWLVIFMSGSGIISTLYGWGSAPSFMRDYGITAQHGFGAVVLSFNYGLLLACIWHIKTQSGRSQLNDPT